MPPRSRRGSGSQKKKRGFVKNPGVNLKQRKWDTPSSAREFSKERPGSRRPEKKKGKSLNSGGRVPLPCIPKAKPLIIHGKKNHHGTEEKKQRKRDRQPVGVNVG